MRGPRSFSFFRGGSRPFALLAAIVFAAPVLTQAQGISDLSAPEYSALSRFRAAAQMDAFIDSFTAPVWAEVEQRLQTANPDRAETVKTLIQDSRQHYREQILQASWVMARSRHTADMPLLVEQTLPYATSPAGRELAERMDPPRVFCFTTSRAVEDCAQFAAELESLRASGNQTRDAYVKLLTEIRFTSMAAMQMSLGSGNRLALLEQQRVKAAGLAWPE